MASWSVIDWSALGLEVGHFNWDAPVSFVSNPLNSVSRHHHIQISTDFNGFWFTWIKKNFYLYIVNTFSRPILTWKGIASISFDGRSCCWQHFKDTICYLWSERTLQTAINQVGVSKRLNSFRQVL